MWKRPESCHSSHWNEKLVFGSPPHHLRRNSITSWPAGLWEVCRKREALALEGGRTESVSPHKQHCQEGAVTALGRSSPSRMLQEGLNPTQAWLLPLGFWLTLTAITNLYHTSFFTSRPGLNSILFLSTGYPGHKATRSDQAEPHSRLSLGAPLPCAVAGAAPRAQCVGGNNAALVSRRPK